MKKSVAIVDDHILFAQSLSKLVSSFENFEVISVFKNGQELVDYLEDEKKSPDIILLDVRMPVLNGIETMEWLKENKPAQKVLALSMEHDEETIIKMITNGCGGYLLKDIEPEEFLIALNSVSETGYYFNSETTEALNHSIPSPKFEPLSLREQEFITLACSEKTYKEVAAEMNLSPKTIDGYRETLFQKLQVKSRVGMVLFAIKNNLVKI